MMILDYVIIAIWLSPIFYLAVLLTGKYFTKTRKSNLLAQKGPAEKKVDKIIFQIPTIGNVQLVNKTFEIVKNYNLGVPVETWAVIEDWNARKAEYVCDKVVVVPNDFECEDLYKARALEYARRLRKKMVDDGELTSNYLLLQGDDDAVPSLGFIQESLTVNADITIGSITPKVKGFWSTVIDYERCVACGIFCNFFTNLGQPLWAHGEGTVMTSKVDQNVSYDISDFTHNTKEKLISSEDSFYFHKAAVLGYTIFNSEERVFIMPPLTLGDAVKQRRRWFWGQVAILNQKMLPLSNRLRLTVIGFSGLWLYSIGMLGLPLYYLGGISLPGIILPLTISALVIWFGMRAYIIGESMGWKHGIAGASASYLTVTLNFFIHIVGLFKGDPRNFEVIRKE
ncbi:MAG TPA: glycosyltransferase family 2 protein [Verrucomicrobiae bacterium]|nr:glycosyltransferase family 2 protein [Verrucomicrobiae bacterium]